MAEVSQRLGMPNGGWCVNGDKFYLNETTNQPRIKNTFTACQYYDFWSAMIVEPGLSEMMKLGEEEQEEQLLTTNVKETVEKLEIDEKFQKLESENSDCVNKQTNVQSRLVNTMYLINYNPVKTAE